jgi:DNA-binding transcriptional ArsR family regulator
MESHQTLAVEPVCGGGAGASMSAAAEVFKAVAHPVRAQILELLSRGESSIPELCEGTGVKATHLSRHLTQMRGRHLIQCRWVGGRLIYRLAYPEVAELLSAARSVLQARTAAAASSLAPRRRDCRSRSLGTDSSWCWRDHWNRVRWSRARAGR